MYYDGGKLKLGLAMSLNIFGSRVREVFEALVANWR